MPSSRALNIAQMSSRPEEADPMDRRIRLDIERGPSDEIAEVPIVLHNGGSRSERSGGGA